MIRMHAISLNKGLLFNQGKGHITISQDALEQNKAMWWILSLVYTQYYTVLYEFAGYQKIKFLLHVLWPACKFCNQEMIKQITLLMIVA